MKLRVKLSRKLSSKMPMLEGLFRELLMKLIVDHNRGNRVILCALFRLPSIDGSWRDSIFIHNVH